MFKFFQGELLSAVASLATGIGGVLMLYHMNTGEFNIEKSIKEDFKNYLPLLSLDFKLNYPK